MYLKEQKGPLKDEPAVQKAPGQTNHKRMQHINQRAPLSTVSYYPGLLTPSGGDRAQAIQTFRSGGRGRSSKTISNFSNGAAWLNMVRRGLVWCGVA